MSCRTIKIIDGNGSNLFLTIPIEVLNYLITAFGDKDMLGLMTTLCHDLTTYINNNFLLIGFTLGNYGRINGHINIIKWVAGNSIDMIINTYLQGYRPTPARDVFIRQLSGGNKADPIYLMCDHATRYAHLEIIKWICKQLTNLKWLRWIGISIAFAAAEYGILNVFKWTFSMIDSYYKGTVDLYYKDIEEDKDIAKWNMHILRERDDDDITNMMDFTTRCTLLATKHGHTKILQHIVESGFKYKICDDIFQEMIASDNLEILSWIIAHHSDWIPKLRKYAYSYPNTNISKFLMKIK
jgi:hypothetical protein